MPRRLTAEQRAMRATIASEERWARESDRAACTKPGRTAFLAKFEAEADPDGILPPDERARRAEKLRRAYFLRLALASSKARAARAKGGDDAAT